MKPYIAYIIALFSIIILPSCGGNADMPDETGIEKSLNDAADKIALEKEQLQNSLEEARLEAKEQVKNIDERLETAEGDSREKLQEMKAGLNSWMEEANNKLDNLKTEGAANWENVKVETKDWLNETELTLLKVKNDLKDLFSVRVHGLTILTNT